MKSGIYHGSGVAKDIPLDFNPTYVRIVAIDSDTIVEMNDSLDDATGIKTTLSDGTLAATIEEITADGVTLGENKFTVGTDADINTDDSKYLYVAQE
jgi:hypothetical protein